MVVNYCKKCNLFSCTNRKTHYCKICRTLLEKAADSMAEFAKLDLNERYKLAYKLTRA